MPYRPPFQSSQPHQPQSCSDQPKTDTEEYLQNASAPRVNTDVYMYNAICAAHPDLNVLNTAAYDVNLLTYVTQSGEGKVVDLLKTDRINSDPHFSSPLVQAASNVNLPAISSVLWTEYSPPSRRVGAGPGFIGVDPKYGQYLVQWQNHEFLVYLVQCSEGNYENPYLLRQYIVSSDTGAAYALIKAAGLYLNVLHNQIWVFDGGFWQKDTALFQAVQKSRWEDVILPHSLKEDLLQTIQRFYDSEKIYADLHVPWKRGIIFYGPPGNGKTISIKATMKTLYDRKDPIPTLYVKSLVSFGGPQYSINQIFRLARQQAPCYLIFEDLDSLITDSVRSFFLNAVDGLSSNDGILMIGSTNHLERLDPGIAKRPSRFDRKYLFPNPDLEQRIAYCKYWQKKLKDNKEVEFPDKLVKPIARLTNKFSFAYIQEAFVSALLKIANQSKSDWEFDVSDTFDVDDLEEEIVLVEKKGGWSSILEKGDDKDDELDRYVLWREIKVQISNLRKELENGSE